MGTEFLHIYGPSLAGAALIAAVHMLAGKMRFLERWDGPGLDFWQTHALHRGFGAGVIHVAI